VGGAERQLVGRRRRNETVWAAAPAGVWSSVVMISPPGDGRRREDGPSLAGKQDRTGAGAMGGDARELTLPGVSDAAAPRPRLSAFPAGDRDSRS
jgi:hypothetical protein